MKKGTLIVLVLVFLAGVICIMRLHTYDEPLERDITFYALVGEEMRAGKLLYTELWDHYPPAISVTYLGAQTIAGYGPPSVYLLGVMAAIATLLGIYRAASADGKWVEVAPGNRPGASNIGLLAAAFWTVVASDLALQANQPNTEVFINACLIWAFAILVHNDDKTLRPHKCLLVGGLLALAVLYKQIAVAPAIVLVLAHWALPADAAPDRHRAFRQVALMAAGGIGLGLVVVLYFAVMGRFVDFWEHVVLFSLYWPASQGAGVASSLESHNLFSPAMYAVVPLAVVAALGFFLGVWRKPTRAGVLLVAYAFSVQVAIALPGTFFPHYYQLWLPVLAVGAAWTLARIRALMGEMIPYLLPASSTVLLGILILAQVPSYRLDAEEWPIKKYGTYGNIFIDSKRAGERIGELLEPGETIWEWGKETGLYFYSKRRPAAGVTFLEPLWGGPQVAELERKVLAQLESQPPELFVVHPLYAAPADHPIIEWFSSRYDPLPSDDATTPFELFVLRGGALADRLRRAPAR